MTKRPHELTTLENPYEAPRAARVLPEKRYAWSLPIDRVLEVNVYIDQPTLETCLRSEPDIVRNYRLAWGLLLLCLLVFVTIACSYGIATIFKQIELATFCLLALIAWVVITPWIFYRTHLRYRWKAFGWAWGTVNVRIDSERVQWSSSGNVFQQEWDGFSQLLLTDNCIWLVSSIPWPIRLPIHRSWVSLEMWSDLVQACRSHQNVVDVNEFFRYRKTQGHYYSIGIMQRGLSAPESPIVSPGQLPFRASSDARYGSDRTSFWLNSLLILPIFVISLAPMAMKIYDHFAPGQGQAWEEWMRKQIGMWPMFLGMIVNLPRFIIPRLAFGARFLQRSQVGMNAQSGFVSRDQVLFASPFHSLLINMPFIRKVKSERDFVVLTIDKKSGQAIVIPRDQFTNADEAWVMLGDSLS